MTIEDVVADMGKRPRGDVMVVVRNFNTDLDAPEGREQDKVIVADLAYEGLEDMSGHFLPRKKPWLKDGCTWAMQQGGREVFSPTDYILGTYIRLFQNVAVHYARHNTYHYLVLGCFRGTKPAALLIYLGKHTRLPIRSLAPPDKADHMFAELWGDIFNPPRRQLHCQAWIYPEIWSLIDTRMAARRQGD